MAGNRASRHTWVREVEIHNLDYPKLVDPRGKKCEHAHPQAARHEYLRVATAPSTAAASPLHQE